MEFSKNLKNEILWRGITQTELAKMMDLPKTTINNWFVGHCNPTLKQFYKLCYVLRVSADELLGIEFH